MNEHVTTAARLHAAETARIEAELEPPSTRPTEILRRWIDDVRTGATTIIQPARPPKQPPQPIHPRLRTAMHWTTNTCLTLGGLTVTLALMNARLSWLIAGLTLIAAGWSIVAIEELRDPDMVDWTGQLVARWSTWRERK